MRVRIPSTQPEAEAVSEGVRAGAPVGDRQLRAVWARAPIAERRGTVPGLQQAQDGGELSALWTRVLAVGERIACQEVLLASMRQATRITTCAEGQP